MIGGGERIASAASIKPLPNGASIGSTETRYFADRIEAYTASGLDGSGIGSDVYFEIYLHCLWVIRRNNADFQYEEAFYCEFAFCKFFCSFRHALDVDEELWGAITTFPRTGDLESRKSNESLTWKWNSDHISSYSFCMSIYSTVGTFPPVPWIIHEC
jgi:hypothetical protein